jgi:geranylgeranylglycerol-phosphate geranylgeranyltransferase
MALNAFVELLRPFNCLMAALAVFIGYCLSLGRVEFGLQVFLAMASAFLVCGGGQAVNDYFDRRVDARLKRWRPIPSGRVSARAALWFAVALFVFGSLLGLAVSALLFGLAVLASLSLFGYSAFMGKVKFVGNWVVAFFVALTYVYGAAITGGYSVVVWLALCAGLSNAGREIVKDLEDARMDEGFKRSLSLVAGAGAAKAVAVSAFAGAVALSLIPFFLGLTRSTAFIALLVVADALFAGVVLLVARNRFSEAQKRAKAAMFVALLAFLALVVVP